MDSVVDNCISTNNTDYNNKIRKMIINDKLYLKYSKY